MEGAEVPIEIIEPLVMTDGGTPIKTPARNSIPRTRKLSTAAAESEKPAQAPAPPDDARHRPSTANAPVTRAESTDGHPVSEQPDTPPQQTNFPKLAAVGTGEVKIVPGSIRSAPMPPSPSLLWGGQVQRQRSC
jgi:hypothetical protein